MAFLKILVCEDEILIASHIKKCIEDNGLGTAIIAKSYNEAVLKLKDKNDFNLAILDINLTGEKSGIDVANYINSNSCIPFLYLTSYTDLKTLQKLESTKPEAYISKPFKNADIIATLNILINRLKSTKLYELVIGKTTYLINIDNLVYAKSEHVYINLYFLNDTLLVRCTIQELLDKLPYNTFIQINRSVIINKNFVKQSTNTYVNVNGKIFKKSPVYI